MRLRRIRDDVRLVGHGFIEAMRPAKTRGDDDPGASGEFEVHPEHVDGLIHQAYGVDAPYEPVDDEAKKAVTDAQAPAAEPERPATPQKITAAMSALGADIGAQVAAVVSPATPDTTTEESK